MVNNAKTYNIEGSGVYSDAVAIWVSSFFFFFLSNFLKNYKQTIKQIIQKLFLQEKKKYRESAPTPKYNKKVPFLTLWKIDQKKIKELSA